MREQPGLVLSVSCVYDEIQVREMVVSRELQKASKKTHYRCSKGFPKTFCEDSNMIGDGYVLPRKPDDGSTCMKVITGKVRCSL